MKKRQTQAKAAEMMFEGSDFEEGRQKMSLFGKTLMAAT
jgi:hypothetical protein